MLLKYHPIMQPAAPFIDYVLEPLARRGFFASCTDPGAPPRPAAPLALPAPAAPPLPTCLLARPPLVPHLLIVSSMSQSNSCLQAEPPAPGTSAPAVSARLAPCPPTPGPAGHPADLAVTQHMLYSPLTDCVHMTGGTATHDAIVWGSSPEEQARRRAANDPVLKVRCAGGMPVLGA